MGKFRSEKDKMPLDKKAMVLTQFPRFLTILEEELFATNSPIWDPDFRQVR
jgi:histone acetyltransferase